MESKEYEVEGELMGGGGGVVALIIGISVATLMLILFGVLGGALTFGFVGIFIGPTLLAVGYRLVKEWASASRLALPQPASTPAPGQPL